MSNVFALRSATVFHTTPRVWRRHHPRLGAAHAATSRPPSRPRRIVSHRLIAMGKVVNFGRSRNQRQGGEPMRLLVVFLLSLMVSQSISIGVGLLVERHFTPYTGLVTFIALYFAMFWLAWRFAIRITEPNAVFGTRLSSAEK